MNTNISTKITALMLALAINSVIMGSVALVFNSQTREVSALPVAALAVVSEPTDTIV